MESADLTRVIIRRKFYSQNTWGYYTQKPQFEYVGSVDLSEVENMKDLRRDLLDFGLTDGDYQLQMMTKKRGRNSFGKKIADGTIAGGTIFFKEDRCKFS